MKTPDLLVALTPVVEAFEQLGISYYIGGSVASSLHGMARATMDVDMIADMKEDHIPGLKAILEDLYYIDEDMMMEAVRTSSSFNLIHVDTAMKIDVFIHTHEPHQRNAMKRRVKDTFDDDSTLEYYFSTPEDIVIAKLLWFERGSRASEHQWLDIIGVMKVQGPHLDRQYLQEWSNQLGLSGLLRRALSEAGIESDT